MVTYRKAQTYQEELVENNGFVIASIIITAFVCFCSILMIILYKFKWKKSYHNSKGIIIKETNFNHE
jgi:hypothetical protein